MLNIYLWLSTATGIPMHICSVGVLRDIDAIWKPHLTRTAWDKWERNLCHSRSPCNELFLKIVVCFGFISPWYTKARMPACYQKGAGGRDGAWRWHGGRISRSQLPPLTRIGERAGPSLRRQLRYAHPPTGSSTSAFPWLPGKSWLPSCLPELPPFGGQYTLHLLKTGFPDTLYSQMITDRQRREIKQGKEFKVGREKDKLEIGFNYTDVMVIRVIRVGRWICKSRKFFSSGNNFFPLRPASTQSWSRQRSTQSA